MLPSILLGALAATPIGAGQVEREKNKREHNYRHCSEAYDPCHLLNSK